MTCNQLNKLTNLQKCNTLTGPQLISYSHVSIFFLTSNAQEQTMPKCVFAVRLNRAVYVCVGQRYQFTCRDDLKKKIFFFFKLKKKKKPQLLLFCCLRLSTVANQILCSIDHKKASDRTSVSGSETNQLGADVCSLWRGLVSLGSVGWGQSCMICAGRTRDLETRDLWSDWVRAQHRPVGRR